LAKAFINAVVVATAANHALTANKRKREAARKKKIEELMQPRIIGRFWNKRIKTLDKWEATYEYERQPDWDKDGRLYSYENRIEERYNRTNLYLNKILVTALASISSGEGQVLLDEEDSAMVELYKDGNYED